MLSLEEAIEFCEIEAKRIERKGRSEWIQELQIKESVNRFRQLAEWLRELKEYKKLQTYNREYRCYDCDYEDSEYYCDDCIWQFVDKFKPKEVEGDVRLTNN